LDGQFNTHFGYIFGASSYDNNNSYVPTSLKTVVITGGTFIASSAFYGCSGLTNITIPSSVTSIGDYAFWQCSGLKTVTFAEGSKLTSIGERAFYECTSLKTVTFAEGSKLTSIRFGAFWGCRVLKSITIPASVTSIGDYAFFGCNSLTSVTFQNQSGWMVSGSSDFSTYTSVTVSNTSTAATYLTDTYCYYYWKRS